MYGSHRYVLFADDDKDDISLMEEAFRKKNITEKLVSVQNGNELLNYLYSINGNNKLPQLILLDLNMPAKGGKETLAELKQHASLKTIPVIIYSTSDNPIEIKECYKLGANSYVVKPTTFDKLLQTIEVIHSYWCKTATVSF